LNIVHHRHHGATFVVSLFSMNVQDPSPPNLFAFWLIMGIIRGGPGGLHAGLALFGGRGR